MALNTEHSVLVIRLISSVTETSIRANFFMASLIFSAGTLTVKIRSVVKLFLPADILSRSILLYSSLYKFILSSCISSKTLALNFSMSIDRLKRVISIVASFSNEPRKLAYACPIFHWSLSVAVKKFTLPI